MSTNATSTLLIDNDRTRVTEWRFQPGAATGFHRHEYDYVVVPRTTGRLKLIDGDGAALMKMGTLATIAAYAPQNLVHLILDNGVHDSTGGQATVSPGVSFAAAAQACGYRTSYLCDSLAGFEESMRDALAAAKPALIHLRTAPGSMSPLGRPTIKPAEVARRFQDFLSS